MIVFVTGASSGIGAAIARRFAREPAARLVLAARRTERLTDLAASLPVPTHVVALDVRDRSAVEAAVGALPADFAAIDVLVNNAGLALGLSPAHEASLDDWDAMFDTNIRGLAYVTRAVLPGMVARARGHVINMGSVAGTYPYPGANAYGASKAFVSQFSLDLRADLHGTQVRVTSIEPGMVSGTEFSEVRFHGDTARAAGVYQGVDALLPEDIAEAVAWCALQPARVNINRVELMPVVQAFGPFAVRRGSESR